MKKITKLTFILIAIFAVSACAQKKSESAVQSTNNTTDNTFVSTNSIGSILFEFGYLPQKQYNITNNTTYTFGEGENATSQTQSTLGVMTTGKLSKNNDFPIQMTMNTNMPPMSMNIVGSCEYLKLPKVKSVTINNTTLTDEQETQFIEMMQSMFDQIQYPKKEIKVGDSFEYILPFNMPIPNFPAMEMTFTHILKEIKGNDAYFDLTISGKLESTGEINITGNITGAGIFIYDIDNHFSTDESYNMVINMKINTNIITIKTIMEKTTKIEDNK